MLTKVRRIKRTRKERKFVKPRFGKTDRGKEFAGPTPGIRKSYKPAITSRNKNVTGQGCTGKPVTSYHDKYQPAAPNITDSDFIPVEDQLRTKAMVNSDPNPPPP